MCHNLYDTFNLNLAMHCVCAACCERMIVWFRWCMIRRMPSFKAVNGRVQGFGTLTHRDYDYPAGGYGALAANASALQHTPGWLRSWHAASGHAESVSDLLEDGISRLCARYTASAQGLTQHTHSSALCTLATLHSGRLSPHVCAARASSRGTGTS